MVSSRAETVAANKPQFRMQKRGSGEISDLVVYAQESGRVSLAQFSMVST